MLEACPTGISHRLLGPRTAFLIGTIDECQGLRLCAASNVTSAGTDPEMVVLALTHDSTTATNILRHSEFTINLMAGRWLDAIWIAGYRYSGVERPPDANVFALTGLTAAPSRLLSAPGVEEAMASLECRVVEALTNHGNHAIFLAEIIGAKRNPDSFDERGVLALERGGPAMQISGAHFATPVPHPSPSTARCNALVASRSKG